MMNKLKELDKTAQEYAGRIVGNDEDSNYIEWFNIYKEKFAELIINECTEQCMSDDYKNILNHFGIPFDEDEELDDGCP